MMLVQFVKKRAEMFAPGGGKKVNTLVFEMETDLIIPTSEKFTYTYSIKMNRIETKGGEKTNKNINM